MRELRQSGRVFHPRGSRRVGKAKPSMSSAYPRASSQQRAYSERSATSKCDTTGSTIAFVEFRLVYKGSLPAQSSGGSRILEKHAIRRQIHAQLRELWHTNIVLERHTRPTPHTRK